jgi:hypothetical protein
MTRLKHYAHAALAESTLELVASVKDRLAEQRWSRSITVLRTVVDFVGETAPTGWTFFH